MSWQQSCFVVFGGGLLLWGLAAAGRALRRWHRTNFARIPRAKLTAHRVTPRLPMGDWK